MRRGVRLVRRSVRMMSWRAEIVEKEAVGKPEVRKDMSDSYF